MGKLRGKGKEKVNAGTAALGGGTDANIVSQTTGKAEIGGRTASANLGPHADAVETSGGIAQAGKAQALTGRKGCSCDIKKWVGGKSLVKTQP